MADMAAADLAATGHERAALPELEDERDFLLRSLDDLERERAAGDIDDPDYEALRDGYTARAAAVLRTIRAGEGAADLPAGGQSRPARRWPRAAIVGLLVLGFAGGAGALVALTAGDRLPGQTVTGSLPSAQPDQLLQARQLIGEGKLLEAVQAYDGVLAKDPRNPEALAYKGWLLRLAGKAGGSGGQTGSADLINRAQQSIEAAVAADPSYPDAHFFLGMILYEDRDDPVKAITQFRLFMADQPPQDMVPLVESELRKAMQTARDRGLPDPGPAPGVGTVSRPPPSGPPSSGPSGSAPQAVA